MEFKVKRFSNFGKYKISEVYLPKFLIKRIILKVQKEKKHWINILRKDHRL
jgi:hypothetical protein